MKHVNNDDNDMLLNNSKKSIEQKESEVLSLIILNNDTKMSIPIEHFEEVDNTEVDNSTYMQQLSQDVHTVNNLIPTSQDVANISDSIEEQSPVETNIIESMEHKEKATNLLDATFDHNIERNGNVVSLHVHPCDVAWISVLKKFEYVEHECRIRGYVDGEKEFLKLWETFQASTLSCFTIRSSEKFYTKSSEDDINAIEGKILTGKPQWKRKPLVPFDGVPFVIINKKYSGCRLGGSERTRCYKGVNNSNRRSQSLKVGCPAEAEVLEVWRVPDLSLDAHTLSSCRHKIRLKKELLSKVHTYISKKQFKKRFYVTFPLISKHQNHPLLNEEAGQSRLLHPKVIESIYECVNQGIRDRKIIRCMLEEFTREFENTLGIKIKTYDRAFYPNDRDLGNHIRNATNTIKSKCSTENNAEVNTEKLMLNIDGEIHEIDIATALNVQNEVNSSYMNFPQLEDLEEIVIQQGNYREVDLTSDEILNDYDDMTSSLRNDSLALQTNDKINKSSDVNMMQNQTFNQSETINITFNQSDLDIASAELINSSQSSNGTVNEVGSTYHQVCFPTHSQTLFDETGNQANGLLNYYTNTSSSTNDINSVHFNLLNACAKTDQSNCVVNSNNQSLVLLNNRNDIKTLLKQEIEKSLYVINNKLNDVTDEKKLRTILKRVKSIQTDVNGEQQIKKGKINGIQSLVSVDLTK